MRLSDRDIHKEIEGGELVIVGTMPKFPFDKVKQVQPSSIDLRLDNKFFVTNQCKDKNPNCG